MRVPIIVLAAAAVALGSTASANRYKDFAAQGYRWVAVDGPGASGGRRFRDVGSAPSGRFQDLLDP